jgi:DNA helicase-2/ATP-dependent DNA helicase PcrA
MTMHAAKGLEFPVVFIVGLEESILPHERSMESIDELEEERRVFFVAMTRAMKRLYLSVADERMVFGSYRHNLASRFLREIPAGLVEVFDVEDKVREPVQGAPGGGTRGRGRTRDTKAESVKLPAKGTRVRSAAFGIGVVEKVVPHGGWHKATVRFRNAGTKKLILEKAGLEIMRA